MVLWVWKGWLGKWVMLIIRRWYYRWFEGFVSEKCFLILVVVLVLRNGGFVVVGESVDEKL